MKRKIRFRSFMDGTLTTMIQEICDFEIKDKKICIKMKEYNFEIDTTSTKVNYLTPRPNSFEFDKKKVTKTIYHTEYGDIDFDVITKKHDLSNSHLVIEYELSQGGVVQAKYRILLDY